MRILFTTAPLQGHFFPLVPLAWAARLRGHDVLVAVADDFVPTAETSGLPVVGVGPGGRLDGLADPSAVHGITDARLAHGLAFARMAAANLAGVRAVVAAWRPDLVVSERAESAGPVCAAERAIPHAALHWGVAELTEYRQGARVVLGTTLPEPGLTLNIWPRSLRPPYARRHLGLRRIPYDGAARVEPWMLRGEGARVCLTLGTVVPHMAAPRTAAYVRRVLDRLSGLDAELVVAVDEALAARLRPLPPAVRRAGRIPLSEILPSCDLLVHHGGNGSSLAGLGAGVPQVVLPAFDDQIENAAAIVRAGAGLAVALDEATPHDVARRCRQVLADPGFRRQAAAVAGEIAREPSPAQVVTALEALAGGAPQGRFEARTTGMEALR